MVTWNLGDGYAVNGERGVVVDFSGDRATLVIDDRQVTIDRITRHNYLPGTQKEAQRVTTT